MKMTKPDEEYNALRVLVKMLREEQGQTKKQIADEFKSILKEAK